MRSNCTAAQLQTIPTAAQSILPDSVVGLQPNPKILDRLSSPVPNFLKIRADTRHVTDGRTQGR